MRRVMLPVDAQHVSWLKSTLWHAQFGWARVLDKAPERPATGDVPSELDGRGDYSQDSKQADRLDL